MATSPSATLDGEHKAAQPVADHTMSRTETMKAIVRDRYGPPDVLELRDIARPRPTRGQVLVSTRAASLFAGDVFVVRGDRSSSVSRPDCCGQGSRYRGSHVAGIVEEVGDGVADVRPGDEVFGWSAGTLAEYVCDSAEHFALRPANLTLEQAAAVPEAGMTALQGLRDAGRIPQDTGPLISARQVASDRSESRWRRRWAEVTGVCSTRNVELARSLGADHVIDYTQGDIAETDGRYDVILQTAGTAAPGRLRRLLTRDGTLVLSSAQGRVNGVGPSRRSPRRRWRQRLVTFVTRENRADLMTLKTLVEAGEGHTGHRPLVRARRCSRRGAHVAAGHAGQGRHNDALVKAISMEQGKAQE